MDEDETELEAAIRELDEETGLDIVGISIAGIVRFMVEMREENVLIANVCAKIAESGPNIKLDPNEHTAYKWSSEREIYMSRNTLPCLPTMVALSLSSAIDFTDQTIVPGTKVVQL